MGSNAQRGLSTNDSAEMCGQVPPSDRTRAAARRGTESWTYIYVVFAVVMAIEVAAFETIPIPFPYDLVALVIVVLGTSYLFLASGWFQNKVLRWKASYEGRFH